MSAAFIVVVDNLDKLALVNINHIDDIRYVKPYTDSSEMCVRFYIDVGYVDCHKTITMENIIEKLRVFCNIAVVDVAKLILEKK